MSDNKAMTIIVSTVALAIAAILIVFTVVGTQASVTKFEAAVEAGLVQESRVGDNGAIWTLPSE